MRVKFGDRKNLVANISDYYVGVTKCTANKYAYRRTASNPTRKPKNSISDSFASLLLISYY